MHGSIFRWDSAAWPPGRPYAPGGTPSERRHSAHFKLELSAQPLGLHLHVHLGPSQVASQLGLPPPLRQAV